MYYDQYYYTQLYDAVKQRQYKDVPFKLRKLGDENADFVKSDNMTEFFNKHKDGMMRGILYILKNHTDYGFIGNDFVNVVKGARKIGLDWPELKIIEKSAQAMPNTEVDETIRLNLKDDREAMLDRLEKIFNDTGTDVYDRIAELDIARNVLRRIDKSDVEEILEKYKTNIIKDTLHYLRHGVVDVEIPVYIRTLKDLGADWPELNIILRSLEKDRNTHELDETTDMTNHGVSMIIDGLEEGNFDLIPYALAIIGAQGHRPTYGFVPEFNKNKTEIIRAMLYAIKNPDDYDLWFDHAPSYMIKGARMLGLNWDELDKIERSVGPVDELNEANDASTRYNMNGLIASIEEDEPREAVLFLSQLSWPDKLPDMSTELQPYIQSIVKAMLEFLKYEESDSEPVDTVRDCLTALKKMNIHNKEIDIIDRSLSIGKQQ